MTVRLPADLHRALRTIAAREHLTVRDLVLVAARELIVPIRRPVHSCLLFRDYPHGGDRRGIHAERRPQVNASTKPIIDGTGRSRTDGASRCGVQMVLRSGCEQVEAVGGAAAEPDCRLTPPAADAANRYGC
jgi:hypothetical protein